MVHLCKFSVRVWLFRYRSCGRPASRAVRYGLSSLLDLTEGESLTSMLCEEHAEEVLDRQDGWLEISLQEYEVSEVMEG